MSSMGKPIVAVVGRPNVGKSTLVNRIAQAHEAIVHESRGVTRDRSYHDADWNGVEFTLVDTGGVEPNRSDDAFAPHIKDQAIAAVDEADAIVFVVDGSVGATDEDEEVARVLRRSKKPVFLVVNKLDNPASEGEIWDFYSLGVGDPHAVSATHGHGTGDLLDEIVAVLPKREEPDYPAEALRVAIVGRPNVGKSSLTNKLAGYERSIVSDVAGTTRDAIDLVIEKNDRLYRLVDTAGMRKRSVVHEDVEYYSQVRGLRAMDEADVCLLVIDATDGVTDQDQRVAALAIERGCALAVLLNKWDLLKDEYAREQALASIERNLTFASWAPYIRISALTGRSVDKVLDLATLVSEAHARRISTGSLNKLITQLRETGHTVSDKGRRLKVHYATQASTEPPTFVLFCNAPDLVDDNYERFIENRLRENFDLKGTPIRLRFRKKD